MAAAYAALLSLLQTIHDIQRHPSPPISLHTQQVESLIDIVGFLQKFLEGYVSPDADGDEADPLEMRIADAVYTVEDVIESHIVDKFNASMEKAKRNHYLEFPEDDVSSDSDGDEADPLEIPIAADAAYAVENVIESHIVDNISTSSEETKLYELDLQQVMVEMDLIKKELMKRQNSVILDQSQRIVSASHVASSSSFSSAAGKNDGMVCPEDVLLEIKEKLVRGRLDLQTIPIVGMGGIGKTTLAKTLYCDQLITEHFDICVWTTISQQFNTREILCELLSQATNRKKEELTEKSENELGLELYQYLFGRRFLIVMDDMWSTDAWYKTQQFFPKNEDGSRVLVTTRLAQLSSQLNNNYNLQMKLLDEVSSWELFTRTVFGDQECCPLELEEMGKEIVSNCRGLPLSIVVVGGLLKKMEHTEGSWESTMKNLTSMVNLDNDKHCLRLLKLSYNHLPVYLRPCFLYMGVFEEDDEIRVSTIVKLWISEGFVKPKEGKSLEATGKELLKDLIDRNLIITHSLGRTGNIKYCKIHDLLRDLCLNQGKKEGFFHVLGQQCPRGINSQRRVIIPRNSSEKEVGDALGSMPHARSVICESEDVSRCQNYCGLLKTVHSNENVCLDSLAFRINLRHFVGRVRSASSLFYLMDILWNLQTLIISCSDIMPIQFSKFSRMRHIEFVGYNHVSLPDPPAGDGVILENLQTLKRVRNLEFGEEVVKRIPNIKKLDILYRGVVNKGSKGGDDPYCFSSIECLSKLESLRINCYGYGGEIACLQNNLSFPHSLKKLSVYVRRDFEWKLDVLEKIGSLPLLEKLIMWGGCLEKGKWEIGEAQFPSLKYLELCMISGLEELAAEEGSSIIFPCLKNLVLYELNELKEMSSEIGNIPTLRKIQMVNAKEVVVKCMKEIVEEQVELQGDPLPFHVFVTIDREDRHLLSLAGPNFEVFRMFSQELSEDDVSSDSDGDEADPLEMPIAADAVEDVIESHIVDKFSASMEEAKKNQYLELSEDDVSSDSDGDEADPLEMPIAADAADAIEDVTESHIVDNIIKSFEKAKISNASKKGSGK